MKIKLLIFILLVMLISFDVTGCDLICTNDIEIPNGNETVDSVADDLQGIIVLCNSPDSGLDPASQSSLVGKINRAKVAYHSINPCSAIDILNEYLREVQVLRGSTNSPSVQFYDLGQSVIIDIRLKHNCNNP
jgi:hypothetical protein